MQAALSPDWLDIATSKGATKWLKQFIRFYLAQLQRGVLSSEDFADELNQELTSRFLKTDAQQKNYRSNVVQALKVLDSNHPAIALVSLSTEQYRVLNDQQKERVADRETRFIHDPEAIVAMATQLLTRAEWSEVGAGLAVLIGRRISEILLSGFAWQSPWSLQFSQMAKKSEDARVTIEIPTLAPAAIVLKATERLQDSLGIEDLKLKSLTERQAKQAVNQKYSYAIADKCNQHFSTLVPARSDKDNLYTHIFRAVYATIAAHWYCPPNIPEHQFKAAIQGHFTLSKAGKKLPNYAARSHYDDYAIGDGQGNRDGRLGIKLGHVQGLQIIDAFRPPTEELNETEEPNETAAITKPEDTAIAAQQPTHQEAEGVDMVQVEKPTKRPNLYAEDLERLAALMAQDGIVGTTADLFHELLNTYERDKEQQQQTQITTIGEVAQTFNWFTREIEALRGHIAALEKAQETFQTHQPDSEQLTALQAENVQLKSQLHATQKQLDGIQALLGGGSKSTGATTAGARPSTAAIATPEAIATTTPPKTPVPSPEVVTSPPPAPKTTTQQRDRGGAKAKVENIINDIINWNTAQEDNHKRLRISVSVIKSLGVLVGATYQPVIQDVLEEQADAIEALHQRFMLGTRHNVRVDKDAVLQAIARDYMGVNNWQEAKYG